MTDVAPRYSRDGGFERDRSFDNHDYRFDRRWKYGRVGEVALAAALDLAQKGHVDFEVKRKSRLDGKFYVELQCDRGRTGTYKPSGLATTEADYQAYVVGPTGIIHLFPTVTVKEAIARGYGRPAEETEGSCPTKGRLLDWFDLLCASQDGKPSQAQFGD